MLRLDMSSVCATTTLSTWFSHAPRLLTRNKRRAEGRLPNWEAHGALRNKYVARFGQHSLHLAHMILNIDTSHGIECCRRPKPRGATPFRKASPKTPTNTRGSCLTLECYSPSSLTIVSECLTSGSYVYPPSLTAINLFNTLICFLLSFCVR